MPAIHTNANTNTLTDHLKTALEARQALLAQMEAEQTNAYRLFHGSVEGESGLTVDRYGDLLLIQTFHRPLTADELSEVESFYTKAFPGLATLYNDRSQSNSRISNKLTPEQNEVAMLPRVFLELGVKYRFQGRHAGQDPWLFLDMRAGRRRVMQEIASKSLLNLFAYTCGIGIAAAKAGARHVVNVDFSESSLAIGKENARLNELPIRVRLVKSDVFAALRQFSGLGQSQRVRGKVMPPSPSLIRTGSTWFSSIRRATQKPVRRRRSGQRLRSAVQTGAAQHGRRRHADLLQQRRRSLAGNLARPDRTQHAQDRTRDSRIRMDHARGGLPEHGRPTAAKNTLAARLTAGLNDK